LRADIDKPPKPIGAADFKKAPMEEWIGINYEMPLPPDSECHGRIELVDLTAEVDVCTELALIHGRNPPQKLSKAHHR
jgi:hypothetical protein